MYLLSRFNNYQIFSPLAHSVFFLFTLYWSHLKLISAIISFYLIYLDLHLSIMYILLYNHSFITPKILLTLSCNTQALNFPSFFKKKFFPAGLDGLRSKQVSLITFDHFLKASLFQNSPPFYFSFSSAIDLLHIELSHIQ